MAENILSLLKTAGLTAEKFGQIIEIKENDSSQPEHLAGQTIRTLSKKGTMPRIQCKAFLEKLWEIAENKVSESSDYSLKNEILLSFYTYKADITAAGDFKKKVEEIKQTHSTLADKLRKNAEPKIISKILVKPGNLLTKDVYESTFTEDLLKTKSITEDTDFSSQFLPTTLEDIVTDINPHIKHFFLNNVRCLRLLSPYDENKFATEILNSTDKGLIQYETNKYSLSDDKISNIIVHFNSSPESECRQTFDWIFAGISHKNFSSDAILRKKFEDIIKDYTFLRYENYLYQQKNPNSDSFKIRPETIALLEKEIEYFVLQEYHNVPGDKIVSFASNFC